MTALALTTDLTLAEIIAKVQAHHWFRLEPGAEPIGRGTPHGEVYYCDEVKTSRWPRIYQRAHRIAKSAAVWACLGCGEPVRAGRALR